MSHQLQYPVFSISELQDQGSPCFVTHEPIDGVPQFPIFSTMQLAQSALRVLLQEGWDDFDDARFRIEAIWNDEELDRYMREYKITGYIINPHYMIVPSESQGQLMREVFLYR